MMVVFLTGLVAMILMRTLKKDFARYAKDEDDLEDVCLNFFAITKHHRILTLICSTLPSIYSFFPFFALFLPLFPPSPFSSLKQDRDVGDESGWKQIHGDVFRAPPRLLLFSALVGTGHQLSLLVFSVIVFSMIGTYYRTYVFFGGGGERRKSWRWWARRRWAWGKETREAWGNEKGGGWRNDSINFNK